MAKCQKPAKAGLHPHSTDLKDYFTSGEIVNPPIEEDTADTMIKLMQNLELSKEVQGDKIEELSLPSLFNEKVEKQDLVYSIMRKENLNPDDLITLATPGSKDGWCMSTKWMDDKGRIFVITMGEGQVSGRST